MTTNAEHDIYSDPKVSEAKQSDPIQEFIRQNWKNLAATVLAVIVGMYFVQSFKESYEASMQASADIFQRLQLTYKEYNKLSEELAALSVDGKTLTLLSLRN